MNGIGVRNSRNYSYDIRKFNVNLRAIIKRQNAINSRNWAIIATKNTKRKLEKN